MSNHKKYDALPYYDTVQSPENLYIPSKSNNIYVVPIEMNPGAAQLKKKIQSTFHKISNSRHDHEEDLQEAILLRSDL